MATTEKTAQAEAETETKAKAAPKTKAKAESKAKAEPKAKAKAEAKPKAAAPNTKAKPKAKAAGNGIKQFYGTGRRKSSKARAFITEGDGIITVNHRPVDEYFTRIKLLFTVNQPLELVEMLGKVKVYITVKGGGHTGQAEAIRLAIARALIELDPSFRQALKAAGYLRRDARIVERKKAGLRKARKREQYSKR